MAVRKVIISSYSFYYAYVVFVMKYVFKGCVPNKRSRRIIKFLTVFLNVCASSSWCNITYWFR